VSWADAVLHVCRKMNVYEGICIQIYIYACIHMYKYISILGCHGPHGYRAVFKLINICLHVNIHIDIYICACTVLFQFIETS